MTEILYDELPYAEIKVDDHLKLRQLHLDESEKLFKLVDDDREYLQKWLPWVDNTKSPQDSERFISETIQKRKDETEFGYAIVVEGNPVGHISLMHIKDQSDPEIGYWIASRMSGKGISTRAGQALTDFGFNILGLEKILIKADPNNMGSNKIAQKLGYKLIRQEHDDRIGLSNVWSLDK